MDNEQSYLQLSNKPIVFNTGNSENSVFFDDSNQQVTVDTIIYSNYK